jgi:ABC-type amino acid transport substrate-binding protein
MLRRGSAVLLVAFAVGTAGCIPPEPDNDRILNFDPRRTTMGAIQESGELIVGVERDLPPLSSGSGAENELAERMAEEIAEALGVELRYVTGTTEELLRMPEEGEADVTFPFAPITEKLVRTHAVTDPYYVAHQKVLVRRDAGIATFEELDGTSICSAMGPDTGSDLTKLLSDVTVQESDLAGCHEMFVDREVDAITAPDLVLAPLVAGSPSGRAPAAEVIPDELNTEAYGGVVERSAVAPMADFVSSVLEEAQAEGRWSEWFEELIAPGLPGVPSDPPGLTVEEAAALYPRGV